MSKTWLVLDVNYLAWRAYHTFGKRDGGLSFKGTPTAVSFGVFRDLQTLMNVHNTRNLVFCFDHGKNLRKEVCPKYKGTRKMDEARESVHKEVHFLKKDYLPSLGFKNIFYQKGYEADDVIATVVQNLEGKDKAIIVSGDHDMYQLLRSRVSVWHPTTKELVTKKVFEDKYNLSPFEWVRIKAIAGCKSDEIPGCGRGIGEATAAKHVSGKATNAMIEGFLNSKRFRNNMKLIKLPFPGCKVFTPQEDEIDRIAWRRLMGKLGMKSLSRAHEPAERSGHIPSS